MDVSRRRWRMEVVAALVLLVGACAAHGVGVRGEFTTWDDQWTVAQNPLMRQGVSALGEIWGGARGHIYIPVTETVWWGVAHVAGARAWGFKGVNLLVHLGCVGLVYVLVRRVCGVEGGITGRMPVPREWWAGVLGAMVFAAHPLGVEAVAWVSGTKDLLGAMLGFGALVCLTSERRRVGWGTALFGLALLAKPTAVWVVPGGAVVLWMMGRRLREYWRVGVVWGVLAGVAVVVGKLVQPAVVGGVSVPVVWRPVVAMDGVGWYLGKMVWPGGLTIDAGRNPGWLLASPERWWTWAVPVGVFGATWLLRGEWRRRARGAVLLVVAAVLPTLGLVAFDFQNYSTVADHYAYPALLGAAIAGALVVRSFRGGWVVVSVAAVAMAVGAMRQSVTWDSSESLYLHLARTNPRSLTGPLNLAAVYLDQRATGAAKGYLEEADKLAGVGSVLASQRALVAANWGRYFEQVGELGRAEECYRRAVELDGGRADLHLYRARALQRLGRVEEAVGEYRRVLELEPGDQVAGGNLAAGLMALGRAEEAEGVARRFPGAAPARNVLGVVAAGRGDLAGAEREFGLAHAISPATAEYSHNLGVLLVRLGKKEEGVKLLKEAAGAGYEPSRRKLGEIEGGG